MYFVTLGFILSVVAVVWRANRYKKRAFLIDPKYRIMLGISISGTVIAGAGFVRLAHGRVHTDLAYSDILTVLALLAAGIVTGYFTFTYQDAAANEVWLPTALALCFSFLFYLVFGALAFYMGKSELIHEAEGAAVVGPVIMWALLLANAIYDFWDYREEED